MSTTPTACAKLGCLSRGLELSARTESYPFQSPKSDHSNLVTILGPIWPLPRAFSIPQDRPSTDIRTCLENPFMATSDGSGHRLATPELPPGTDIQIRASAFLDFRRLYPQQPTFWTRPAKTGYDPKPTFVVLHAHWNKCLSPKHSPPWIPVRFVQSNVPIVVFCQSLSTAE